MQDILVVGNGTFLLEGKVFLSHTQQNLTKVNKILDLKRISRRDYNETEINITIASHETLKKQDR